MKVPGATRWTAPAAILSVALLLPTGLVGGEIHRAVLSNDVARIKAVVARRGPDALGDKISGGATPLHLAAALDNGPLADLLVKLGADVSATTDGGFTPLHWAASRDAGEAAEVLIEHKAHVNAGTKRGVTPLHWAAAKNATNVARRLMLAGADINKATSSGMEPLHWAVRSDSRRIAAMLALKKVRDKMSQESIRPRPEEPEMQSAQPDAVDTGLTIPPTPPSPHRRTPTNRVLTVDLGLGHVMSFVLVEKLRIWMGQFEVTNGQFRRFRPTHNSMFRENFTLNDDNQPVVFVSWNDASAFCGWLNSNHAESLPPEGKFRLPTQAEWAAAARCGTDRAYPWGNDWPPPYGNYSDLTARKNLSEWRGITGYEDGHVVSCAVAESGENEWGIYGMAGNVWEWCLDWADESRTARLRCGGCWDFDEEALLRVDAHGFDRPVSKYATIGFRVVIGPPPAGLNRQVPATLRPRP
jgi:hypothetical protein